MYTFFVILFVFSFATFFAGIFARLGTDEIKDIDTNAACSMAYLFIFCILIISFSSARELAGIVETISGGIPYLDKISDYGSLHNLIYQQPFEAVKSFLDMVVLGTIISTISNLNLNSADIKKKFMVRVFTGVMVALISLIFFNFFIKNSDIYTSIVYCIGAIISIISVGSIPVMIYSLVKKSIIPLTGVILVLITFSKSKIVANLKDSFFKSIIFLSAIYILEMRFGDLANVCDNIMMFLIFFGPFFVVLIGLFYILKSVFA